LIRHLIGQARGQLLGRRRIDGPWQDHRLINVQYDLLRPCPLGSDPDGRPFDDPAGQESSPGAPAKTSRLSEEE
jgi:hypothetical protein